MLASLCFQLRAWCPATHSEALLVDMVLDQAIGLRLLLLRALLHISPPVPAASAVQCPRGLGCFAVCHMLNLTTSFTCLQHSPL